VSCNFIRDTQLEEGRFLKSKMENLANKVKESDFEIVSIERKNGNEFAPNCLI
jgi:DNA topoisomerase-3